MSEAADRSRAEEASRWFTVVTNPSISVADIHAFRLWREDPANDAAFSKVERMWGSAKTLAEDPDIKAATQAALRARPPRKVRTFDVRPMAISFASLVVLGGGALIAVNQLQPTYQTQVGGQRLEVLSDGSRVRLNTDTKIKVAFSDDKRRIELLRGEAFFEVAHDADRPFIVDTGEAQVRALGTKFDVRRDNGAVRVTLIEGRVQVRHDDQPETATLAPNQTVTVTAAGVSQPRATDAMSASSWTTGRLTFTGVPLKDAIREVNRYSKRKIVLNPSDPIGDELVSGQFEPGDTGNFLAGVEAVYGLQVVSETAREIRLGPKASGGG